jgi:hypothetical protein
MEYTFKSPLKIGDVVHIDQETSIRATVTGVWFNQLGLQVEVSWIHNGGHYAIWMQPFRLSLATAQRVKQ